MHCGKKERQKKNCFLGQLANSNNIIDFFSFFFFLSCVRLRVNCNEHQQNIRGLNRKWKADVVLVIIELN